MKPAPFDYVRAKSLADAHEVLAAEGSNARVLAGGQTLLPMLSMRLARPKVLVDIMQIPVMGKIASDKNTIRIDAGVRQSELLAWHELETQQPLLARSLPWVGHAQTRSSGTVCGSVAHADPSAELPLVLVVLDGAIELSSRRRRRRMKAEAFFTGMMSTACEEDELIEAVLMPVRRAGEGCAFREFGRRHGDFAIVAAAAVVTKCNVRLAIGGVGDRPIARDFSSAEGSALEDALDQFAWDLDARGDLHATASYRRMLVRKLGAEVIKEASRCCV